MSEPAITVQPLTGLRKALGYKVPGVMAGRVVVGSLVRVPIRRRTELAIVREMAVQGDFPVSKLKYILDVVHPHPVLNAELLKLGDWMGNYYAASPENVFEAMIPAAVRKGMRRKVVKMVELGRRLDLPTLEKLRKRAPKQAALYELLVQQSGPLPRHLILQRMKVSTASCDALVEKGIIRETDEDVERIAYDDNIEAHVPQDGHDLNAEQLAAFEAIRASLDTGGFHAHLLHGVTGSGKTEVYIHALKHALEGGGGAIYLVPEVALTPQTVSRLRSRLEEAVGARTVVWHSHLSDGERLDSWHALASGEAHVVVGARSAVFAPVRNLRLIIVDEEHEPAYKQEETPRYHGRDVAVFRASQSKAVCVLGSATPALESLYNVKLEKYRLNRLTKRVDDRQLPLVHVVDMTRENVAKKGPNAISGLLAEKMRDRFEKQEQSILFLNRRGYAPSMTCPECSWTAKCEHCSITLTYHRTDKTLRCHLCGYEAQAPYRCPDCKDDNVRMQGYGTQRIEEVVQKIVPAARVARIDADAMRKKHLFRKLLDDFRTGKLDILVGTQMIAKGLDFPNVTLVGLVGADLSMHIPDFRAAERTFQLMVQVAGRAGRGDRAGEVVVQSFMPHSPPIQFARQGDFEGFFEAEMDQRREFDYPPYRHLIHHLFRGKNPDKITFYAERWAKVVEEANIPGLEVRGPAPAPLEKMKDNYRFQIWFFTPNVSKTIFQLTQLRNDFQMDREVIDVFDVDPVSLL